MPNLLVAGNSTNGGTAITTDTSGTLNIVTGSGSGATAVTLDGSGNMVVTGTLTASGGVSGGIRSGTAVTASGTSVDFTSLPTGLKRITVMFSGLSTNGTSNMQLQLGTSGGIQATGYTCTWSYNGSANSAGTATTGFIQYNDTAADTRSGAITFSALDSSAGTWVCTGQAANSRSFTIFSSGVKTLSGTLDRVRITTVNGTDTFDAGTINILYE